MSGSISKRRAAVGDLMAELAVADWKLDIRGKHLRLQMVRADRKLTYFLSATPGDVREWLNSRAGIRRLLRQADGSSSRT